VKVFFVIFIFCPTDSDTFNIWKTKGKGEGGNESADRQATSSRSEKREKHVDECLMYDSYVLFTFYALCLFGF
jgi:hypothetical protein